MAQTKGGGSRGFSMCPIEFLSPLVPSKIEIYINDKGKVNHQLIGKEKYLAIILTLWKCEILESAKVCLKVAQLLKHRKKYILWLAKKDFGRGYNSGTGIQSGLLFYDMSLKFKLCFLTTVK